ncbi:BatD family protein [Colwellia sp. E2M01]|uniref:BatD family protein n=1 Tax=Colwellia sp. E2M01 TaxID=2841561 RepID=UPI001C09DCFC|nr:BatD family protein [Colwellia sp. E2M01]MBU2870908.1 BatD family protein [Colwellia sp. E2M01]
MTKHFFALFLSLCLVSVTLSATVSANSQSDLTIADLVKQNKLRISLTLPKTNEEAPQIVGQPYVVSIEVATDRWFDSGSKIANFSLPHVVMPANNIITTNGSQNIAGTTWSTQTHDITLYPNEAGRYDLPSIEIKVSVNTEHNGSISGVLSTKPVSFDITLPEALEGVENFIVSPEASLTIDGQFDAEQKYALGDAITQTITIKADDIPAMMIPEIQLNEKTLEGISIYHKPAQVFDTSNRGTLTGTRVESFTYIFEKSGDYSLPEQVIYWWNSNTNTLETLEVPASRWTVSTGGVLTSEQADKLFKEFTLNTSTLFKLLIFLIVILVFALLVIKRQKISAFYKTVTHYEKRQLQQNFLTDIAKKDYLSAEKSLYRYAVFINKVHKVKTSTINTQLNLLAFSQDNKQKSLINISSSDAKKLIKHLSHIAKGTVKAPLFIPGEKVRLNG